MPQKIDRLKQEGGYIIADVIRMHSEHPQKAELRQKFLDEHIHKEDEVRFFVRRPGRVLPAPGRQKSTPPSVLPGI